VFATLLALEFEFQIVACERPGFLEDTLPRKQRLRGAKQIEHGRDVGAMLISLLFEINLVVFVQQAFEAIFLDVESAGAEKPERGSCGVQVLYRFTAAAAAIIPA